MLPSTITLSVTKRDGSSESFDEGKILKRMKTICPNLKVDRPLLISKAKEKSFDGITTSQIDRLVSDIADQMKLVHTDYGTLASHIYVANMHKTTPSSFSQHIEQASKLTGKIPEHVYHFVMNNREALDAMINNQADYDYDYVACKLLEDKYLLHYPDQTQTRKVNGVLVSNNILCDRAQYMLMRKAIQQYMNNKISNQNPLDLIKKSYTFLSRQMATHATPTALNSCTIMPQLSSCFLLNIIDSTEGIMKTAEEAALISRSSGGIGFSIAPLRSANQPLKGIRGKSSGIVPQIKIFDSVAQAYNQGSTRPGAFAIYNEPWHGDILSFLALKLQVGEETLRARSLFYGLWSCDLFMERAKNDKQMSLFSEDTSPHLSQIFDGMWVCSYCDFSISPAYNNMPKPWNSSDDTKIFYQRQRKIHTHSFVLEKVFTRLYEYYENAGRAVAVVSARAIMGAVTKSMADNGTPYVCHKDAVNRMSPQMNVGTVTSSNLCTEIMEVATIEPIAYATCNLASINLKKHIIVVDGVKKFCHDMLGESTKQLVHNLCAVIDNNRYPTNRCKITTVETYPLGIGMQGLADTFIELGYPYDSPEARKLAIEIVETMYFCALMASIDIAKTRGPYAKFYGSPMSMGYLHPDLWLKNQHYLGRTHKTIPYSGRYDVDKIRQKAMKHGVFNSMLIALMPTVSTSKILENNDSFEPLNGLIFTKTGEGKTLIANKALIKTLEGLGLWSEAMKNKIINNGDSVQGIEEIPPKVRALFKTVWEIKQRYRIELMEDMQAFIDQAASLNIFAVDNSDKVLRGMIHLAHEVGLKTGSYYIRTNSASNAPKNNQRVSETKMILPKIETKPLSETAVNNVICNNDEGCFMCGS